MCDYSLHAVTSRPAEVGEELVTTTFRGTSTRGFASEKEPGVAVCLLPGTELAFTEDVRYDNRWIWTRTINSRVGKFGKIDPLVPERHHDAVEFADGSYVLVTQLVEGQRVIVLQLPVTRPIAAPASTEQSTPTVRRIPVDSHLEWSAPAARDLPTARPIWGRRLWSTRFPGSEPAV